MSALHCQQEAARFITQDLGADYLIGLKGNQSGILERAQCKLSPVFFPPEKDAPWIKDHGRIVRRRAKAVSVSPEEIGLCGCWQILAVERLVMDLSHPVDPPSCEIAYYVTSRTHHEMAPQELLDATIGHWEGIENGTHFVRDVSFGEDACRICKPTAARNMVTLRNFAIGLHCLQKRRGITHTPSLPSWRRSMKAAEALRIVLK